MRNLKKDAQQRIERFVDSYAGIDHHPQKELHGKTPCRIRIASDTQ